jgi:hypothetical protein
MSLMQKLVTAVGKPGRGTVARGLYELDQVGGMDGKTELDWVRAMGRNPEAISDMPGGMRLLQWASARGGVRQRVAVLFGGDHVFVKIASRYQV